MKTVLAAIALLSFLIFSGVTSATVVDNSVSSMATQDKLKQMIAGSHRPADQKDRDRYRQPFKTLTFFGLETSMSVVEIWPGGQGSWYRKILQPLLKDQGSYIPLTKKSNFPAPTPQSIPDGGADMVLAFRAHGFMTYQKPVQKYYDAIFNMLKPGGIFGIVDHAGNEAIPQDPEGKNGYVNESHVIKLAQQAGFELVARSDINNNPKDSKNYPKGVWSLPPTLAGSLLNRKARDHYLSIGESDRFTLRFRKPI